MRIIGGILAGAVFLLVIVGGGIYRSECVKGNGRNEQSWGIGEVIPYTSNTKSGCETHTLTRYVLGKIGVASDVEHQSYQSDMIGEIGTGSVVLPAVYSTVRSSAAFSSGFNKHGATELVNGELDKVSERDLTVMSEADARALSRLPSDLKRIDALAPRLQAAHVRLNNGLSPGSKRFVNAWNALLSASLPVLNADRLGVTTSRPVIEGFEGVVRAAQAAKRSGSTAAFNAVRQREVTNTKRIEAMVEKKQAEVRAATRPVIQAFSKLASDDSDAKSIIAQVNQRYPHGLLAQGVEGE